MYNIFYDEIKVALESDHFEENNQKEATNNMTLYNERIFVRSFVRS